MGAIHLALVRRFFLLLWITALRARTLTGTPEDQGYSTTAPPPEEFSNHHAKQKTKENI